MKAQALGILVGIVPLLLAGCQAPSTDEMPPEDSSDGGGLFTDDTKEDSVDSQDDSREDFSNENGTTSIGPTSLELDSSLVLGDDCKISLLSFDWPPGQGPGSPPQGWDEATLFYGQAEYVGVSCSRIRWAEYETIDSHLWIERHNWAIPPQDCLPDYAVKDRVLHALRTDSIELLQVALRVGLNASSLDHDYSLEGGIHAETWHLTEGVVASAQWPDEPLRTEVGPLSPSRNFWNPHENQLSWMEFSLGGNITYFAGRPGIIEMPQPLLASEALINKSTVVEFYETSHIEIAIGGPENGDVRCQE